MLQGTSTIPRLTKVGIAAVVVMYLAAALFSAISLPWKGSADSFAHMDYVYQVYHGQLPRAFGYQYRKVPLREFNIGNPDTTNQWTASHPPLFYYLASLQMGRSLETGKWQVAVKRGRLINVGIGLLCVLALAWAGWELGGRYRARLAIALPAIGGTLPIFIRLAGDIYNDLLVTLFSILALVISALVLRDGPRPGLLVALMAVCALGMSSKATFIFAFVVALGAVSLAVARRQSTSPAIRLLRGAAVGASLAVLSLLPIAWFYFRNYKASGSPFLSTPKAAIQNRPHSTAWDVLTSEHYWLLVPRSLLGPNWNSIWPHNERLSMWIAVACAAVLLWLLVVRGYWRQIASLDWTVLVWALLAIHFGGLMFAQFHHSTGWGALNFRYFVPGLLSIALFVAVPVVAWRRLSGWLTFSAGGLMLTAGVFWIATYLDRRYAAIAPGQDGWARLVEAIEGNGVSAHWTWMLASAAIAGLVVAAVAVGRSRDMPAAAAPPQSQTSATALAATPPTDRQVSERHRV